MSKAIVRGDAGGLFRVHHNGRLAVAPQLTRAAAEEIRNQINSAVAGASLVRNPCACPHCRACTGNTYTRSEIVMARLKISPQHRELLAWANGLRPDSPKCHEPTPKDDLEIETDEMEAEQLARLADSE